MSVMRLVSQLAMGPYVAFASLRPFTHALTAALSSIFLLGVKGMLLTTSASDPYDQRDAITRETTAAAMDFGAFLWADW